MTSRSTWVSPRPVTSPPVVSILHAAARTSQLVLEALIEPSSLASHFRALRQPDTAHTTEEFPRLPITMQMSICVICLCTKLVSIIPYPVLRARVQRFLGT
jgi:hypothetical protein